MRKLFKIFTVLAAGALALVLVGSAGALYLVHRYGADLPDYRQLAHYQPPTVTRVHAADGRLLAEFAHAMGQLVLLDEDAADGGVLRGHGGGNASEPLPGQALASFSRSSVRFVMPSFR